MFVQTHILSDSDNNNSNDMNEGGPVLPSEVWDQILEPLPFGMRFTAKSVCRVWCRGAVGDHNAAYVKHQLRKKRDKKAVALARRKNGLFALKVRREVPGLGTLEIIRAPFYFTSVTITASEGGIFTYSYFEDSDAFKLQGINYTDGRDIESMYLCDSFKKLWFIKPYGRDRASIDSDEFTLVRYIINAEGSGDNNDNALIFVPCVVSCSKWAERANNELEPIHAICRMFQHNYL